MDLDSFKSVFEDLSLLSTRKRKAFYLGCLGIVNLGDEAMLIAFQELFGKAFCLYSKNYDSKLFKLLGKKGLNCDVSILGGGTLINATSDTIDTLIKCKTNKRIVFGTGVRDQSFWDSVADHQSDIPKWVDYLNSCDYIGVRGPKSHAILKQWGVTKEIKQIGDPVLFLSDANIYSKRHNKVLGVNFGTANGKVWGKDEEVIVMSMISLLKRMQIAGWSFKFFPVCPCDIPIIKRLATSLSQGQETSIISNFLDYKNFKKELRSVDVFIGMKLHSVIFSIATYTPSIMIEYRPKCRDFMQSINRENLVFRCDKLDVDILEATINQLYVDLPQVQQRIFNEVQRMILILETEAAFVINLSTP